MNNYFEFIKNILHTEETLVNKLNKEIIILLPIFSIVISILTSKAYSMRIYIMMGSLVLITSLYYIFNINKRGLAITTIVFYIIISLFSFDQVLENFEKGVKEREIGRLLSVSVYDKENNLITNDSIYFVHKFSNYTILGKKNSNKDYMIYPNDDISRYEYKKIKK